MKLSTSSVTFSGVYIFNGPNLASFSFLKNTPFPVSFFFIFVFSMQLTINVNYDFLLMTGFEPWTAGVGSNHSNNWATNTARPLFVYFRSLHQTNIAQIASGWCAWDSNLGWQDGRCRRIQWDMAANYKALNCKFTSYSVKAITDHCNEFFIIKQHLRLPTNVVQMDSNFGCLV